MSDEWRTDATDAVVRLLAQTSLGVSPGGIAANVDALLEADVGLADVEGALELLAERDMAETLDSGEYYRLTERGREYASAEFGEEAFGYVD